MSSGWNFTPQSTLHPFFSNSSSRIDLADLKSGSMLSISTRASCFLPIGQYFLWRYFFLGGRFHPPSISHFYLYDSLPFTASSPNRSRQTSRKPLGCPLSGPSSNTMDCLQRIPPLMNQPALILGCLPPGRTFMLLALRASEAKALQKPFLIFCHSMLNKRKENSRFL